MSGLNLYSPLFHDKEKAREFIEELLWPNGTVCAHCNKSDRIYELKGKSTPLGSYKCGHCRKRFTVTTNTIFHGSHIPLNKWLAAIFMMASSKKGVSAHQIHRSLGITYKSAWYLCHRVREAMELQPLLGKLKGPVESDETYVGPKNVKGKRGRGAGKKVIVQVLIDRNTGEARSFQVDRANSKHLKGNIRNNVDDTAYILTDEYPAYDNLDKEFAGHYTVNHGKKEYTRGLIHVNFAESYFSLLKRSVIGTFHHISKAHMHRYLKEFDRRWTERKLSDDERTRSIIKNVSGKRLKYA
ncbi:MAG: IS1595 family transposase [Proteobacteria bacterium]|nr:IS1595 family transposase [Pseudomonadota bacterium]